MFAIELTLLIIAYSALIISLVFAVICYKRRIESLETIAFTLSLLLLIICISVSSLLDKSGNSGVSNIPTLLCMVLVSATTFLNTLSERRHTFNPMLKKIHIGLSILLFAATIVTSFSGHLSEVQWAVVVFLISSVAGSMLIIRITSPQRIYVHLEKSNKLFANAFLIIVPLYLVLHYGFASQYAKLQIGFLLPVAFILLAANKTYDDLKRLSIVKNGQETQQQQFTNYGLTDRETEVARLLSQGCSYQYIAEQLFISMPTVKTHASNVYKKCHVKNKYELSKLLTD